MQATPDARFLCGSQGEGSDGYAPCSLLYPSLRPGYTIVADADAPRTFDTRTADVVNAHMRGAGAHVLPHFGVATDIQRDWRKALTLLPS